MHIYVYILHNTYLFSDKTSQDTFQCAGTIFQHMGGGGQAQKSNFLDCQI